METRRQDLLNRLEEAAATAAPECLAADCKAICFQILFGLPPELQIRAAGCMLQRYLPIFEKKQPSLTWARRILEDPDGWDGQWSGMIPDHPEGADSADMDYWGGFGSLNRARRFKDDPVRLAANACCTVADVAQARARNVWLADDPEAARIEREEDAFWVLHQEYRPDAPDPDPPALFKELESPAHGRYYNAAFIAVYRREWIHVVEWLRAEEVWKYPEPDDLDAMKHGLKRWEECECTFLTPIYVERGNSLDDTPE
jgi:hypothetical protein